MRKVIYKEWVRGIETEEYKQWKKDGGNKPQEYVDGTHCYIEHEGLFHGFFPTVTGNNDVNYGNITEAWIELEDGHMVNVYPSLIRFVDSPETDQLAEFAKAAMQGLLSNREIINTHIEDSSIWVSEHAIMQAKSLIAELKKPQE